MRPMQVGKGKESCLHLTKCKCKLYVSEHMVMSGALTSLNTGLIAMSLNIFWLSCLQV